MHMSISHINSQKRKTYKGNRNVHHQSDYIPCSNHNCSHLANSCTCAHIQRPCWHIHLYLDKNYICFFIPWTHKMWNNLKQIHVVMLCKHRWYPGTIVIYYLPRQADPFTKRNPSSQKHWKSCPVDMHVWSHGLFAHASISETNVNCLW